MNKSKYQSCSLCPRNCMMNRLDGELGFCSLGPEIMLSSAVLHWGEEPPISDGGGSGTLFFSGCTLGCTYCQNFHVSSRSTPMGKIISSGEFIEICIELQARGAENINLVTGTHFIPSLVDSLPLARSMGLTVPIVWNSSGFESEKALKMIDPLIDIYLIDVKTLDPGTSGRFCGLSWYPDAARYAVLWIVERNPLVYAADKLIQGVIIRHLVLPGELESSRQVLEWYSSNIGNSALISVMHQFIDPDGSLKGDPGAEEQILRMLDTYNINEGFLQELVEGDQWIPDFSRENPFPEEFSKPVWHWERGFIRL